MRATLDPRSHFPSSCPSELSVLSWNLLAEEYYNPDRFACKLAWAEQRLPLLRSWLARFASCDVLCFQEVDRASMLGALEETLAEAGFSSVVQDRGSFPVVNAVFFKTCRLSLAWAEHRSRVLIVGLALPDGRQLGVVNVHLEAGLAPKNEAQRVGQLGSALRRLRARGPWCSIVCGDFNSPLTAGSQLPTALAEAGLSRVSDDVPTIVYRGWVDTLDHIWAGSALRSSAVLGKEAAALREVEGSGLPNKENPSDHLPVAALFDIVGAAPASAASVAAGSAAGQVLPVVEAPMCVGADVQGAWLGVLEQAEAGPGVRKAQQKQQRRLEAAFLSTLGAEDRAALCRWRDTAVAAAQLLVATAASRAVAARRAVETPAPLAADCRPKCIDPGGRPDVMVALQGG